MGRIANRYRQRVARVTTEAAHIRNSCGLALEREYGKGLESTLYNRTPRPVTHKLHDSTARSYSGWSVRVGHRDAIAVYSAARRAMKGIGNYRGRSWNKDAPWNQVAVQRWLPMMRDIVSRAHQRILRV